MTPTGTGDRWINALIAVGSAMFLLGLTVSAAFAAEWRLLHVFQALIYLAVIVLTRRKNPWGYGGGFFVAAFWNWLSVVTTTATRDGIAELLSAIRSGQIQRPDLLLSLFAATGHLFMIVGCLAGLARLRPTPRQWLQWAAGGLLSLAYLVAIVFAFGPPQAIELMKKAVHAT